MSRNNDPFAPWNDPMNKNDPFAPHNGFNKNNPFKPWNSPLGSVNDLTKEEKRSYGIKDRDYRDSYRERDEYDY